ncbi:MAG: glutathione S-transferase family protein [Pseudomonadota bacterium]
MILYGRYLSPFVRRVACWLNLQGRPFELHELAATDPNDLPKLKAVNPIARVPALVLDDGVTLTECFAICDWLDETAPEKRLIPADGLARRDCLQRIAIASATTDKAVALVYDKNRRPEEFHWPQWQERLIGQITGGLGQIEASLPAEGFFGGSAPNGADIATAALHDFLISTNPFLIEASFPKLGAHAARANTLEEISSTRPA